MRHDHLHIPGVIFGGLTLMVGLAAMNSQNNLLFWLFGMLFAAILVSMVVSRLMIRQLRIRRLDPQYGAVGEPLLIRYGLTNRSRLLPAFNVHIEEQPVSTGVERLQPARAWIMHMGPRETVHGEAVLWPTARGTIHFDRIRVWTTFPFGIIKRSIVIKQPQHTLVYPQLYELRSGILRAVAPPALIGNKTILRPGPPDAGDEYFGLREHRASDSIRSIAWKRSAQLDQLVCIERSMPSPPKLRIVLNLTVPTEALPAAGKRSGRQGPSASPEASDGAAPSPRDLEERAISLAASIAHLAHQEGMEISLAALGTRLPRIGMRRGHWHLHKIMAALASIDLDAPRDEHARLPVIDADRAGVVVIHPDRVGALPASLGRGEALHLTGRQLESLAVRPIGWDAARTAAHKDTAGDAQPRTQREVAA